MTHKPHNIRRPTQMLGLLIAALTLVPISASFTPLHSSIGISVSAQALANPPQVRSTPDAPREPRARRRHRRGGDQIERQLRKHLVPPRLIMRHMDRLELTQAQRARLKEITKNAQVQLVDVRFELQRASQALIKAIKDDSTSEEVILKRADELMALEAQKKRVRLQTALKVRVLLTPEQRERVKTIKSEMRDARRQRRRDREGISKDKRQEKRARRQERRARRQKERAKRQRERRDRRDEQEELRELYEGAISP